MEVDVLEENDEKNVLNLTRTNESIDSHRLAHDPLRTTAMGALVSASV